MTRAKTPPARRADSRRALRILVANGVNLDLLGTREPEIYGRDTLADVERALSAALATLATAVGLSEVQLTFFQTNEEPLFLAKLGEGWDGALLNPGAWTHTSLAIADRLKALALPYVEVHISNLAAREEFRRHSFAAPGALGVVHGFGVASYQIGLYGLLTRLAAR